MHNQPEPRRIEVDENEYRDAEFNGYTVRVTLFLDPNQRATLAMSHEEAVELHLRLDNHLRGFRA